MCKVLIIANNAPDEPNRISAALLTGKVLAEKGNQVSVWLYNNAVYLINYSTVENIQAPGLPPVEDLLLFLETKNVSVYVGLSCAEGRGVYRKDQEFPLKNWSYAPAERISDLINEHDKVLVF